MTTILSDSFRACLVAVDTSIVNKGAAVADMLAYGHAEYLDFDSFKEAVKAGLSVEAWKTVTNYMGPMRRAWDNKAISKYCEIVRESGIFAANKAFPAGTGKKGFKEAAPVVEAEAASITAKPTVRDVASIDAMIAAAMQEEELTALRSENESLKAELMAVKAELMAAYASMTLSKMAA